MIALRDLLTHRRGELRTDQVRALYNIHEFDFPDLAVSLSRPQVSECLEVLSGSIERVDRVIYRYAWTREPLAAARTESLRRAAARLFVT